MSKLLVDDAAPVATLTLNRPEKRNALDSELLGLLRETLAELDSRGDIAAIILTGSDPAFSAGLDLDELSETADNMIHAGQVTGIGPIPPLQTPLIAAVNGPAVTGGFELVTLCDLVVASDRARFADTHARLGLLPDWGLTALLPQAVGVRKATELLLTSNFMSAQEAHDYGLVNAVVPHEQLLPAAQKLAGDIASNDRVTTQKLLAIIKQTRVKSVEDGLAIEAEQSLGWQGSGIDTDDVAARREDLVARNRAGLQD